MNVNENQEENGACDPETSNLQTNNRKPKLIYYYDALCGWCYGFGSVMKEVEKHFGDQVELEVVSGGLFRGERVGPINEVAPYIKDGAYKTVEEKTGVKFGAQFLEDIQGEGRIVLDSLPPAMALCIVKDQSPEHQLQFAERLLHSVYFEGSNPVNLNLLGLYATEIGFDSMNFAMLLQTPKYQAAAEQEFAKFAQSQLQGMPALILEKEGEQILLSNGYTDFQVLQGRLEQVL
ncbi:MAG: DsbA family protein [Saprospiraceae bacterium]